MPRKGPQPLSVEASESGVEAIGITTDLDHLIGPLRATVLKMLAYDEPQRAMIDGKVEIVLPFRGGLDMRLAATSCDVIRQTDRTVGDVPTWTYIKRKTWTRLPGNAILTLIERDAVVLNPEWFGTAGTNGKMEHVALPARRVAF